MKGEKKSEQVLVNLPPSVYEALSQIAEREDRPNGYVARELMMRGLAMYQRDGHLRHDDQPPLQGIPTVKMKFVREEENKGVRKAK